MFVSVLVVAKEKYYVIAKKNMHEQNRKARVNRWLLKAGKDNYKLDLQRVYKSIFKFVIQETIQYLCLKDFKLLAPKCKLVMEIF